MGEDRRAGKARAEVGQERWLDRGIADRVEEIPFPAWLDATSRKAMREIDERAAGIALAAVLEAYT